MVVNTDSSATLDAGFILWRTNGGVAGGDVHWRAFSRAHTSASLNSRLLWQNSDTSGYIGSSGPLQTPFTELATQERRNMIAAQWLAKACTCVCIHTYYTWLSIFLSKIHIWRWWLGCGYHSQTLRTVHNTMVPPSLYPDYLCVHNWWGRGYCCSTYWYVRTYVRTYVSYIHMHRVV